MCTAGGCPVHVRCLIDECAGNKTIPELEKLVATIRSREISGPVVLPAQCQLKAIYKDNADTIIGNMGIPPSSWAGKEPTTLQRKLWSRSAGQERPSTPTTPGGAAAERQLSTIRSSAKRLLAGRTRRVSTAASAVPSRLGGVRHLSDKYDITKHPNYPYTADADPKNAFDIEAFLSPSPARSSSPTRSTMCVKKVDAEGT